MWKISCTLVLTFDESITEKDAKIVQLTARVAELEPGLARTLEVDPAQPIHPPPYTRHIPAYVPAVAQPQCREVGVMGTRLKSLTAAAEDFKLVPMTPTS